MNLLIWKPINLCLCNSLPVSEKYIWKTLQDGMHLHTVLAKYWSDVNVDVSVLRNKGAFDTSGK